MLEILDPSSIGFVARFQQVIVFVIVAGVTARTRIVATYWLPLPRLPRFVKVTTPPETV